MNMNDLRNILLPLLTVSLLTACTQDELAEGNTLPDGQYPLTFSVDGISVSASTRSTVEGNWVGAGTVAVQIGDVVKEYKVTADANDNTKATLSSTDPFYWQKNDEVKRVTAWHPYNNGTLTEWKVADDQSSGISNCDFIYAQGDIKFTDQTKSLTFHHQMAKVVVNVVNETLNTTSKDAVPITLNNVSLTGTFNATATNEEDKWKVDAAQQTSSITPHPVNAGKSYEAIVIPQTIAAGNTLFTLNVNGYDSPFYYTVPTGGITWKAGNEYTYDITVTPTGLEVTTDVSIGWTEDGTSSSGSVTTYTDYKAVGSGTAADPWQISNAVQLRNFVTAVNEQNNNAINDCIKLTNDIDVSGMDWIPICGDANDEYITKGFNGVFDGNGHTITGLSFSSSDKSYFAFIRSNYGTIKDLTIKDCSISYTGSTIGGRIAGIAATNDGNIVNCHLVGGNIDIAYYAVPTAGIASSNHGKIIACSNSAAITAKDYAYGITWRNYGDIIACCNTGALSASNPNYDFGLGGICDENIYDGKSIACYYIKVTESNKYSDIGTELTGDDWTDAVDAMNTALSNNGYGNYKWTWSGNANEAPTVVINN